MLTKVSTIGSADGSIIAAIITAHIARIANTLSSVQRGDAGIVSCANGWPMSTTIQARNAQAARLSAASAIDHAGSRAISASAPGAGRLAESRSGGVINRPLPVLQPPVDRHSIDEPGAEPALSTEHRDGQLAGCRRIHGDMQLHAAVSVHHHEHDGTPDRRGL